MLISLPCGVPQRPEDSGMGSSLALSIMTATKELERIVVDQHERDGDVVMAHLPVADVPPVPTSGSTVPGMTTWLRPKTKRRNMVQEDDDETTTQDDTAMTSDGETDDDRSDYATGRRLHDDDAGR